MYFPLLVFCVARLVLPVEDLGCESALYWRSLCEHLRELGAEADEHLEKVLPNGTELCKYIAR